MHWLAHVVKVFLSCQSEYLLDDTSLQKINNVIFCTALQDQWMTCQRNWLYLESIFSAPDIQRQLPAEARMFTQVDKSWKEIMRRVNRLPNALRAATHPGM